MSLKNDEFNIVSDSSFIDIVEDEEIIPFTLKDNFSTELFSTTSSSNFLSNFCSGFNSTVYDLLKNAGLTLIAKTNSDEFGFGGTGTFSKNGNVLNPYDKNRISGGSSSGSAVSVSSNLTEISIGSDTGDSVRKPASYNNIIGFKPTYGSISRFGLFPFSPSLDHVGIFTKNTEQLAYICDILYKKDDKDLSSIHHPQSKFLDSLSKDRVFKIAILKPVYEEVLKNPSLKDNFLKVIKELESHGNQVEVVDFDKELLESMLSVYRTIAFSEGYSCYSNLTGIAFGPKEKANNQNFEEYAKYLRSKFLGSEIKERFLIGAYTTSKENFNSIFVQAKKVRAMINKHIQDIYNKGYNLILSPGSTGPAPLIKDVLGNKSNKYSFIEDILLLGNFTGFPSITVPSHFIENMP
jgi:aspartyl-tRNA(Asn)/glutamyl-tRNA(Gln) amidotransferase subunit A